MCSLTFDSGIVGTACNPIGVVAVSGYFEDVVELA
jgi:hypothetical protein